MKKAFTMVELVIVTIIVGLLAVVMFNLYITLGKLMVKIEAEKNLHVDMMYLVQTLQTKADEMSITGAVSDEGKYLTGLRFRDGTEIVWTGQNLNRNGNNLSQRRDSTQTSFVVLQSGSTVSPLTDRQKNAVNYLRFQPFGLQPFSGYNYEGGYATGFYLILEAVPRTYNPKDWSSNTKLQFETFFTIRG